MTQWKQYRAKNTANSKYHPLYCDKNRNVGNIKKKKKEDFLRRIHLYAKWAYAKSFFYCLIQQTKCSLVNINQNFLRSHIDCNTMFVVSEVAIKKEESGGNCRAKLLKNKFNLKSRKN